MRTALILLAFNLSYQLTAQSDSYELIVRSSQDKIFVGDNVEYSFYVKNNSNENISVPTAKSQARGIDDVLTHTFEIFDNKGTQINKSFKCGVGGADRRILSGVLIKPGDSSLLVTVKFNPTVAGTYKAIYLFDFHPNNGVQPNPSSNYKTMLLTKTMNIEVYNLDANIAVTYNRISAEELAQATVFNSISSALANPDNVYRLKLDNPTMDEIVLISKFKNIQDLSLNGGTVDSLPVALFDLNYRFLDISVGVKNGLKIPEGIKKSTDLISITLKPIYGADLSGFVGGKFPKLRFINIMSVSEPLALTLPVENMPSLEGIRIIRTKSITVLPSDFSSCPNLKQFEVGGESVVYGNELIINNVTSLNLYGNSTNIIPNMSQCNKLETLNLANMKVTEVPAHILDIPNLKQLIISKDTPNNETLKLLKKKGVEIIKI